MGSAALNGKPVRKDSVHVIDLTTGRMAHRFDAGGLRDARFF
jgi:hypothetical protein